MTQTPTAFETRYGFARHAVTLANWRTRPFSAWSFQHVSEMVPSAEIAVPAGAETYLQPDDLLRETLDLPGGGETVGAFLARSATDALTVMKRGAFVGDYTAPTMDATAAHLVFSISKSLTAIVAGTLQDEGLLDPHAPAINTVPEAKGSAYADATVQQILDMRVSLDFVEDYLDPESAFARYRRAMKWNPGGGDEHLLAFLVSIPKGDGPHGGPFCYRSPNSDLLSVIVERVSGQRLSDLLHTRVLQKVGAMGRAMVTVDGEGTPRAAGGVSVTARDLARVGEMMRNSGMGTAGRVVSEDWIRDTLTGGDKTAWKAGDMAHLLANGAYRNKWYATGTNSGAFCCIGIHGQWLYVDPSREVVIVKMSSQALPVDDALDRDCLAFFDQVAGMV